MYSDRNVEAEIKMELWCRQQKFSDTNVWLNTEIKLLGKSINAFPFKITTAEVFLCKYFEFYARGEKIPFDQKEQILTSVDALGIKTVKKLLILDLNGIMAEVSFPLLRIMAFASLPLMSTELLLLPPLKIYLLLWLIILATPKRMLAKMPLLQLFSQGVISSFLDHCICASLADADRTNVVASSQDTSSPLDDHTCNFQVDACKDTAPTSVGVVLSSPYRGICASP
ncbi:hypothetical protein KY290_010612 [Solanum tuberosum]|uniref:Uncharacterized protein n=1 Tax=Solanum tuberosum TaxID=4113 RepID=A0ABQ7W0C2_SOLTU|nr:hypothetical protein KY290_010612 [Solanum tuberosum]